MENYQSFADEMERNEIAPSAPEPPPQASPEVSAEDQEFINSYESFADEMDAPEQDVPPKVAPEPPKPTKESLEERLRQLQKEELPKAELHYDIDNAGIKNAVKAEASATRQAEKASIQKQLDEMSKEQRRKEYMERIAADDPEEDPEEG